jgi:hypothetical protein
MNFFDKPKTAAKRNSVTGKVGIGIPTDEMVFVSEDLLGKSIMTEVPGLVRGTKLKDRHLKMLIDKGITEVQVAHGGFPQRLEYFRLSRRSTTEPSLFIADPALNAKYGLGDKPTKIPIVVPIDDVRKMVVGSMKNYDRTANRMFCSSAGGETAVRAIREAGEYTGRTKDVSCVPHYPAPVGQEVCAFRRKATSEGKELPCKFNGVFYFNILSHDVDDFDLGSFFKFETGSYESADNIHTTMQAALERFGHVDWIPFELQVVLRKKPTPGGKLSKVPIVMLAQPTSLMREYKDVMEQAKELLQWYAVDDVVEIDDVVNEAAYDAEFRPDVQLQELTKSGLDVSKRATRGMEKTAGRLALEAEAMRLPPDAYQRFVAVRDTINADNIEKFRAHTHTQVALLSEADKALNFDLNSHQSVD